MKTTKGHTFKTQLRIAPYKLRISRLTIDKLGVKLYDKVSAVAAELIANSYDADAERVSVRLPLNTALATKKRDGTINQFDYVIEFEDNGHGMTPNEAIAYYLEVGKDRRRDPGQGGYSRGKRRPVMGRKGIGKLAPFGICKRIEVISAGGQKTSKGFEVAHFYLDYDVIVLNSDKPVNLERGNLDRSFRPTSGTTVRLSNFLPKRVPDAETFHRQLASRFVFATPDFKIFVEDTRSESESVPVAPINVATVEGTRIDLASRPVITEAGEELPVGGWLAMAKESYKNEEMAGVRIYARNKIVATTRDFEQPAGFTGEFTVRSYLVGEVHAEWLDRDEGEDLIRSDRQGILWDSEYGRALRDWGANLIKEIGKISKEPRRKRVRDLFMTKSDLEQKAKQRYSSSQITAVAIQLGNQIGSFAAEDELEDSEYVEDLAEIILSVAPHKALIEAFQDFSQAVSGGESPELTDMVALFGKAQIAELASYSQIAAERVRALRELEKIVVKKAEESQLQELIARAPWLVDQAWTVMTKNQALKTFKTLFEEFYFDRNGERLVLAIDYETKRPDFTLVSLGHKLHVVEIKAAGHKLNDADAERLFNYVEAFDAFFDDHPQIAKEFPERYQIDLIVDGVDLKKPANRMSLKASKKEQKIVTENWNDFLAKSKKAHEQFLEINDRANAIRAKLEF